MFDCIRPLQRAQQWCLASYSIRRSASKKNRFICHFSVQVKKLGAHQSITATEHKATDTPCALLREISLWHQMSVGSTGCFKDSQHWSPHSISVAKVSNLVCRHFGANRSLLLLAASSIFLLSSFHKRQRTDNGNGNGICNVLDYWKWSALFIFWISTAIIPLLILYRCRIC